MTAFFFGAHARRLFGIYHPAENSTGRTRAAVLCYPWGPEYLEAHRSVRRLAALLAAGGIHVLRFDYFGTGDSAGDVDEGDADGWEADIGTAIAELRDTTGAARVTLVGLRLGALLAANVAAARRREIDALVLWDPLLTGAHYRRELIETAAAHAVTTKRIAPRAARGGGHEVLGHPLTDRLAHQLDARNLADVADRLPRRTLLAMTSDAAGLAAARAALAAHPTLDTLLRPEEPCWLEVWPISTGAIPVTALAAIAGWLA